MHAHASRVRSGSGVAEENWSWSDMFAVFSKFRYRIRKRDTAKREVDRTKTMQELETRCLFSFPLQVWKISPVPERTPSPRCCNAFTYLL